MTEVCWAPMLAAFSVPLDQSDDEVVIAQCLEGFRHAIHVTAVLSMKTHRDAFITSLAKFTSLHSPADIKQKNIDAIKVSKAFSFSHLYRWCSNVFIFLLISPYILFCDIVTLHSCSRLLSIPFSELILT